MLFTPTHYMADGVTPCGFMNINHKNTHRTIASLQSQRYKARDIRPLLERIAVNPDHFRNHDRERNWKRCGIIGMTVEHYDELLISQDGVCAICAIPPIDIAFCVDHDHTITDRYNVRGLLCRACNQRLGYVEKGRCNPLTEERAYLARAELRLAA